MKQALIVLSLVAATTTVVMSEPVLGGLVALGLLKLGAFKLGAAIGASSRRRGYGRRRGFRSRRRFGRSVEAVESDKVQDILLKASVNDVDDCAKNLVCQLNTKSIESMDSAEQTLFAIYGQDASIDVSRSDVEFQLAANIGHLAGAKQCQTIYARCPMEYDQLLRTFENKFTSTETLNQL